MEPTHKKLESSIREKRQPIADIKKNIKMFIQVEIGKFGSALQPMRNHLLIKR